MRSWVERSGGRLTVHLSAREVWTLLDVVTAFVFAAACFCALTGPWVGGWILFLLCLGTVECRERAFRAPDAR